MIFAKPEDHYLIYKSDFVRDLRDDPYYNEYPTIFTPADYNNEAVIRLAPSQRTDLTSWQQKKLADEWVDFLTGNKLPLEEVQVVTRLSQRVFDALCTQDTITSLRIKWLFCKDISHIAGLKNLKKLFIESGAKVESIAPLVSLEKLEVLILGETIKITDYSCLKDLKNLKVFSLCSYQSSTGDRVMIEDIGFLDEMPSLEYVDIIDAKVIGKKEK